MRRIDPVVPFPSDAQSHPFFGALATALLPALGVAEDTPYFCLPKGRVCDRCGGCGKKTNLQKFHGALYHQLQSVCGVSFGWAWPEDPEARCRTVAGGGAGWRWSDGDIGLLLGRWGLGWRRLSKGAGRAAVERAVRESIDAGRPALLHLGRGWDWHVATGYAGGALVGLDSHAHYDPGAHPRIAPDRYTEEGLFELADWYGPLEEAIVLGEPGAPTVSARDALERAERVLGHPAHRELEAELARRIDAAAPGNAWETARWLNARASFPIEGRWHAAEAFGPIDSEVHGLIRPSDGQVLRDVSEAMFDRYIADGRDETHGVCWRIWGLLGVGPETGYALGGDAERRLLGGGTQTELKRLFALVFENDRKVLAAVRTALQRLPS